MKQDFSNQIASDMQKIMADPAHKNMFSSSGVLEKLAFKRVADENQPSDIEIEIMDELQAAPLAPPVVTASAQCACGKSLEDGKMCKCASENGCSSQGCKDGCGCGCGAKKAGVSMSDSLVKSAFDALMRASTDLEEAGFERLSAHTLVLLDRLIVEAKDKKDPKKNDKKKDKKDDKKDKKSKDEKSKDKNLSKDKFMKDKLMKDKFLKNKFKSKK